MLDKDNSIKELDENNNVKKRMLLSITIICPQHFTFNTTNIFRFCFKCTKSTCLYFHHKKCSDLWSFSLHKLSSEQSIFCSLWKKGTPAWKRFATAGCGSCDNYQVCSGNPKTRNTLTITIEIGISTIIVSIFSIPG